LRAGDRVHNTAVFVVVHRIVGGLWLFKHHS